MIDLILAFLFAVIAATQPAPTVITGPPPPGVNPAPIGTTIDHTGLITEPDGTTRCVTASPCAYNNWTPEQADTIDPIWAQLEANQ